MAGVFSYLGGSIDNALNTFVNKTSAAVSIGITPLVVTGLTIWVMVYGYAVMRHEVSEPINQFLWKATKTALILAFALSSGIYQSEVVGSVQSFQDGMVQLVAPSANGNIYKLLDDFDSKGASIAMGMLHRASMYLPVAGWLDLLAGCIVFVANAIMLTICGGFVLMAKVGSTIVLGIGPLFIASLAFPPLAKFFDAWFSKIMNYALLVIILAVTVGVEISICDGYVSQMYAQQQAGFFESATNQVGDAVSLVMMCGALLLILWQAPHLASGLAGGASLSGGGLGQFIAGAAMNRMMTSRDSNNDPKNGGEISNGGGGGGQSGGRDVASNSGNSNSSRRVPAYRRASQNRYGSRR